jgi:hypothetical protein
VARRDEGAVGDHAPPARPLDGAQERHVLQDVAPDGRVAAGPVIGRGVDAQQLAVGRGQRRTSRPLGRAQRQRARPRPLQQGLDETLGPRRRDLARVGADQLQPRRAQQGDGRGETGQCQHDVGVDEHEHGRRRVGSLRELVARPRLAEPARGQRGPVEHGDAVVVAGQRPDDRGGAVGRAVVEHEDVDAAGAAVGRAQERLQARADVRGLVADRQQHRDVLARRGRVGVGGAHRAEVVDDQAQRGDGRRGADGGDALEPGHAGPAPTRRPPR